MALTVADINLFLLVFMRMSGAILFNPLLGRGNVPLMLKAALSLVMAFLMTAALGASSVPIEGFFMLGVSCIPELLVGLVLGTLVAGLISVVLLAGELIDFQMGYSMAVFYEPKAGINMPVVGSLFNALLIMVFFAGNAHLALFRLIADSFVAIPPGSGFLPPQAFQFVVMMGRDLFELGLRLALPILAVELVAQLSMGILMKAVPQINIFTVGLQLQAIIGIALLLVLVPMVVVLNDRLTAFIIEKCVEAVKLMIPH